MNIKMLFVVLVVLALALIALTAAPAALARSGWGLEDPQLCVNGTLLTVTGQGITGGTVVAPKGATVDYIVEDCGGNSDLGVIPSSDVSFAGKNLVVTVYAPTGTQIHFVYGSSQKWITTLNGAAVATFTPGGW